MTLIVALRLFSKTHARLAVESTNNAGIQRGKLVDVGVDRLYPVLKNAVSYLALEGKLPVSRKGLLLKQDDDGALNEHHADALLYWCEIETSLPTDFWRSRHEVEVVLDKADLEEFSSKIRGRSGGAYIDACESFARSFEIRQYPIKYQPPVSRRAEAV